MAKRGWPDGACGLPFHRRDRDARVDGDDAGLVGENRIEIDLADFRKIGGKLGQLDQEKFDGAFVGGGHVAIGLENARDPRARDQPTGQREVERRQRQRLVVDHFDGGAALAEHDDGTECRIVGNADDQFARLGAHDHGKDGHAANPRLRLGLRARGEECRRRPRARRARWRD